MCVLRTSTGSRDRQHVRAATLQGVLKQVTGQCTLQGQMSRVPCHKQSCVCMCMHVYACVCELLSVHVCDAQPINSIFFLSAISEADSE